MKKFVFMWIIIIVGAVSFSMRLPGENKIHIPSIETVLSEGYPKNRYGQTYGPHIGSENPSDLVLTPDLILAENHDGIIGYIKSEDFNVIPNSIEEALEITRNPSVRAIPMYLQDGVTKVGMYHCW